LTLTRARWARHKQAAPRPLQAFPLAMRAPYDLLTAPCDPQLKRSRIYLTPTACSPALHHPFCAKRERIDPDKRTLGTSQTDSTATTTSLPTRHARPTRPTDSPMRPTTQEVANPCSPAAPHLVERMNIGWMEPAPSTHDQCTQKRCPKQPSGTLPLGIRAQISPEARLANPPLATAHHATLTHL